MAALSWGGLRLCRLGLPDGEEQAPDSVRDSLESLGAALDPLDLMPSHLVLSL